VRFAGERRSALENGPASARKNLACSGTSCSGDARNRRRSALEAIHDSPGAWLSLLVYRCRGDHYEPAFAESFGPRGAELILDADTTFDVFTGEWRPEDPGCCPSQRRRRRYKWNDRQQRFVLLESTVVDVKEPSS
jgi:hypothetical protein